MINKKLFMCDFPAVATFFLYCFARKGFAQYRFERILSFNSYFLYNPYFSETKRFRYHHSRNLFVVLFYLAVVFHIYFFIAYCFSVIAQCFAVIGQCFAVIGQCFAVIGQCFAVIGQCFAVIGQCFYGIYCFFV